jgi:hypothetical protein
MATRRNYDDDRYDDGYDERPRRTAPRQPSNAPAWIGLALTLCVALLIGAAVLVDHFPKTNGAADTAPPAAQPTLTAAQLAAIAAAANQTAAEQQTLKQAIPTEDTSKPPALPVQATAAAITQPSSLDHVPAGSLSPVDTTWRPVPTPTTMLPQAQFDASQASEEQNFLNTSASGLTPAQQMVQQHDAEWNASHP